MGSINVSLPEDLRVYLEQRALDEGQASGSEYVRESVRGDRGRERLRASIAEGHESGPARTFCHDAFDDLVVALDAPD